MQTSVGLSSIQKQKEATVASVRNLCTTDPTLQLPSADTHTEPDFEYTVFPLRLAFSLQQGPYLP
jgi:hypothetical protein